MAEASETGIPPEGEDATILSFMPKLKERQAELGPPEDECLEMALAVWAHPITTIDDVSERVAHLRISDNDAEQNERLRNLVDNIGLSDGLYTELLSDSPDFAAMVQFLQETQKQSGDAQQTLARRATLNLTYILSYAYQHPEGSITTEEVTAVFEKIYYAMRRSGQQ